MASLLAMEQEPRILTTKQIKAAAHALHRQDDISYLTRSSSENHRFTTIWKGIPLFRGTLTVNEGATLLLPALYMITWLALGVLAAQMLVERRDSTWLRRLISRGN